MTLNHIDPAPLSDYDGSVTEAAATPPDTTFDEFLKYEDPLSPRTFTSPPLWPGSTYMIRSVTSRLLLTLQDGQVSLEPPNTRGSTHWDCVETKGWLGFRNPISGTFLGHDLGQNLICSAKQHLGFENFCARARPEGGFVLLMTHWERLQHVGVKNVRGAKRLAKLGDGGGDGEVWEFVPV